MYLDSGNSPTRKTTCRQQNIYEVMRAILSDQDAMVVESGHPVVKGQMRRDVLKHLPKCVSVFGFFRRVQADKKGSGSHQATNATGSIEEWFLRL